MKLRNLFMGLGILPVVLIVTAMLTRPVHATAAMVSTAPHLLAILYLPTDEVRVVGLFPNVNECKLVRNDLQAKADTIAPGLFVTACLPVKLS